jgi:hypothetical protein
LTINSIRYNYGITFLGTNTSTKGGLKYSIKIIEVDAGIFFQFPPIQMGADTDIPQGVSYDKSD